MIYMCYVIIMYEPFFYLIYTDKTTIWCVYYSKGLPYRLEINVDVALYVVNQKFQSLPLQ